MFIFIQLSSHKKTNIHVCLEYENTSINQHKKTQIGISYPENKQIQIISWLKNGKYHRSGGAPAIITYFRSGQIQFIAWYKNGEFNRIDGPAIIAFENGQLQQEEWFKNGKIRLFSSLLFSGLLF